MTSESSNTAALVDECAQRLDIPALVAELRRVAAELRVEVTYDSTIHDVDRQAVALNNAAAMLSRAAGALSDLAKELEEARAEVERLKDFGGDAVAVAGQILENLGIGQDASKEPGADRRRDRVAAIIERNSTRQRDEALAALKASEAREAELRAVIKAIIGEETLSVHVGYDDGPGGGNFVYADAVRVDSDAFDRARAVLSTKEVTTPRPEGPGF